MDKTTKGNFKQKRYIKKKACTKITRSFHTLTCKTQDEATEENSRTRWGITGIVPR